jgi:hypothetical protein
MRAGKGEPDPEGLPTIDDETLKTWRAEALPEQPKPEDWADLVTMLRWAGEIERRGGRNAKLPKGMTAPEYQLRFLVAFLERQPAVRRHGAAAPLARLLAAIGDLAEGKVPTMFQPTARPSRRPQMAQIEAMVRGVASRAMSLLIQAGQTEKFAAQRVAAVLGEKPEIVQGWRKSITRKRPTSPLAREHYQASLPPEAGDTSASQAEFLLKALKANAETLRARKVA